MQIKQKESCGSVFEDRRCELNAGHFGKHRNHENFGSVSWTDQGAARVERETAEAGDKKKIEFLASNTR